MCREGRYNLDPNIKFFSLPPVHGALRKYVDHPADFCFKLPDCLTFEQGALVEPLSIAGQTNSLHWRRVLLLVVLSHSGCNQNACMFLQQQSTAFSSSLRA